MIDPSLLYRRLEVATFKEREQIADEIARAHDGDDIATLVRGLDHPHAKVRLGVIEILRRAGYRPAIRKLLDHARRFDGDDRVFAVRALTQLAQPGDEFLAEAVRAWSTSGDPYLEPHAHKLAQVLSLPRVRPPDSVAVATEDTLEQLVVKLFAATRGADRIALLDAIERRGPQALAAAARLALHKGNPDLVALAARALIRHAAALPAPDQLTPLLEAARRRLGEAPIASAAIDDALVALGGPALSPSVLARLRDMDEAQVDGVVQRLAPLAPAELAQHAPALLEALAMRPALWPQLGPVLAAAAPHVRAATRAELRRLVDDVVAELRAGKQVATATAIASAWILGRIAEPGEPLPRQLRSALERAAIAEAGHALTALCVRLATEEAAETLLALAEDPVPAVATAARDAIRAWRSPWVKLEGEPAVRIVTAYEDERGQPLVRRGDRLVAASGDDYVLDVHGRPIASSATEFGGCVCCSPKHVLARRGRDGLRCPSSWEAHLHDGDHAMLAKDHPLGRCRRCGSPRPRIADGDRRICVDCGAGSASVDVEIVAVPVAPYEPPPVPSEHGRQQRRDALPQPPSHAELEHVAPAIRAAIVANVFLVARERDGGWNGSGIVIARDGEHAAILTNRHVVETDDHRVCAMRALTVANEVVPAHVIWRAARGIDLAVVEAKLARGGDVGVMPLGTGAVLVGAEVFAIGNPLGLAWSYTAGTLSAVREWKTSEGQAVRILQTDANLAPGSSGGGLFHRDGHLLGVMSFLHQGPSGGSAHFALSVAAIRAAFTREAVRWRGRPLAELA